MQNKIAPVPLEIRKIRKIPIRKSPNPQMARKSKEERDQSQRVLFGATCTRTHDPLVPRANHIPALQTHTQL